MNRKAIERNKSALTYSWRVTMGWGVSAVFFMAAATGFYLVTDRAWGLMLRVAAFGHPALGIAATVWLFFYMLRKMRAQDMPLPLPRLLAIPGALMALLLVPPLLWPVARSAPLLWLSTILVFLTAAMALKMPRRTPDVPRGRYYFYTGGLIWALWLALLYTGLAVLFLFMRHNIIQAVRLHAWISYGLAAFFLAHLYAVRPLLGPEVRAATPVGRPVHYGLIATALMLAAAVAVAYMARKPVWTVPLNTFPMERRPASERRWPPTAPVPRAGLERVDVTHSCGNATGCHKELLGEHVRSAHNISVQPRYFQVNLKDMGDEVGSHNQIICAGCHFPVGAVDQRKKFRYFKTRDNFSCVFCHSLSGGGIDARDPKRSWYRVAPPWQHLRMFPPGLKRAVVKSDRLLIRLNAMGHRRAFKKPFHSSDGYCQTCHHLQMPPLVTPGLRNPKCILCHMQPQKLFGGSTRLKSHLFAGANPGPALLMGDKKTAGVIRRWAEGRIVPKLKGWETIWSVRRRSTDPIPSVPWIRITFYHDAPPRPDRDFTINLYSTNTGLGHNFPSASLDLAKAWLEFDAATESGRVFCSQGKTATAGPIPKDTATLGGYMMGRDGKIVTRNRVWQVAKKVFERRIMNLEEIKDTITCRIPRDAGHYIHISARWNYRKLDQDFLDYAYGKGRVAIPPVIAGQARCDIPVKKK